MPRSHFETFEEGTPAGRLREAIARNGGLRG
jgi:hypothetical protein